MKLLIQFVRALNSIFALWRNVERRSNKKKATNNEKQNERDV